MGIVEGFTTSKETVAGYGTGEVAVYAVEVEDFDYAYGLYDEGIKLTTFGKGRIGYRKWARRRGYIHSLDDRYDHDVDELMSR